jgi:uncharacterized Zn finger protein
MANVVPAIRNLFDSALGLDVRQRADVYACSERLVQRRLVGDRITACAEGNHGDYAVWISVGEDGIESHCDCRSEERPCKHLIALARTYLEEPETFIRPS